MVNEQLQEGQLVSCIVDKVMGTTVFVRIEGDGEGTITLSEIAPGRIRNLRDYVIPGKRIVCKVLGIRENYVYLSLRRVGINEKKEFLQKKDKERANKAILKTVLGEVESEKVIKEIVKTQSLSEFFEEARENPKNLDNYLKKSDAEKIIKILDSKKEKPKEIRQIFRLSSKSSDGIVIIKNITEEACSNIPCNITYLAAGKYSLSIEGKDFKEIKNKVNAVLESIEKSAKKQHCEYSVEKS
jgi:translation initiation factor 2 alpha subunit (eIF-2alpha)